MLDAINLFRRENGRGPIETVDLLVSDRCMLHCYEMVRRHQICHAPDCYLEDWKESVAIIQCTDGWKYRVVSYILGSQEEDKRLLLDSNILAFASFIYCWTAFVTIRGKTLG